MLKKICRSYIGIGVLLYSIFGLTQVINSDSLVTFFLMFFTFISFGVVVYELSKKSVLYYNDRNLGVVVFFYSLFIIGLNFFVSYYFDHNFFVFSNADSLFYFNWSWQLKDMSFLESISYLSYLGIGFDDWAAFLWISSILRILPSQLFLGFIHCVLGVITAINIFSIAKSIMQPRYAFFAALTFSISSFTLLLHNFTLKESLFVFVVIFSFRLFYNYLSTNKFIYLVFAFAMTLLVLLFRTPVCLILVFCYVVTLILRRTRNIYSLILIAVVGVVLISTSYFSMTYDRYLRGGDIELILERKNQLAFGGGVINQITDPIAALVGPFPSVPPTVRSATVLYSSGLLFRVLLSGFFFFASYYAIVKRQVKLYPLIIFFLLNSIGLIISVKGLETRLAFPHLPMMYIVAFWGISMIDWHKQVRNYDLISKRHYRFYIAAVFGICVLWNIRGFL